MKSFAVVLCVLVALGAAWAHTSEEEVQVMKDCASEYKVTADDMKSFVETKETTKDVKCFLKCMMESFHGIKEGNIDAKTAMKEHGHDDLVAIGEECIKKIEKSDDLCETTFQHAVCMLENDKDGKVKAVMTEHLDEL